MSTYSLEQLNLRFEKQKRILLLANLVMASAAFDMLFVHHPPERIAWLPPQTVFITAYLLFQPIWYFGFCFRTFKQTYLTGINWTISMGISLVAFFTTLFLLALYYTYTGVQDGTGTVYHDPYTCFYFTVVTWTTIGYGDFIPTPTSRPFVVLEALVSYLFTALFLALLIHTTNILYSVRHPKQA
jgi:Ion channel